MTDKSLPIAILVAAGFAETTFTDTQKALIAAGRKMTVISPDNGLVQGWHEGAWGHHFMADAELAEVLASDYSALILPDGKNSADTLAENPHTKRLISAFLDSDKQVLAVGDAVSLLVSSGLAAARRVAGPETLAEELNRAGAQFVPEETVVIDGTLITSNGQAGNRELIETFLSQLDGETVQRAA